MIFDLATLRTRIGITDPTDTSKDSSLTYAMTLVTELLEQYLDRKLLMTNDTEKFTHFSGDVLSLHRYPIHSITSINGTTTGLSTKYHWSEETGLVHFDAHVVEHELTVVYNGGFATLPDDLVFASLLVFDGVWGSITSSGVTVAAGTIQSVTVADVGTIRYATGAAAATSGSAGAIPAIGMSILESYRRMKA